MATGRHKSRHNNEKTTSNFIRNRLWPRLEAVTAKAGRLFSPVLDGIKRPAQRLRNLPMAVRILAVYLLVLLAVGSIFYWRLFGLRVTEPYSPEPSFEWEVYTPGDEPPVKGGEEGKENRAEEQPEGDPGEPETGTSAEPAFVQGIRPVSGPLYYAFHEPVVQTGPGYPLYYTAKGIAVRAEEGTPVAAAWSGIVTKVGERDRPHGQSVTVEHDNGLTAYYGALGRVDVKEGQRVERGEIIGAVGSGYPGEPSYLYLEMLLDGRAIDPQKYLAP